jgi:leucyl/phenylalanyl-tRNA--protein transferase
LTNFGRLPTLAGMTGVANPYEITPQILLRAYAVGMFPMAESAEDPTLFWVDPQVRGLFPLDGLLVGRRLARTVRSDRFRVVVDRDFDAVIAGCAATGAGREGTWINERIRRLYRDLYDLGHVHTVECYRDGVLAGGLYGVSIGAAFFGESMFHRETDASKVALVHLVARLRRGGFRLLDAQFVTPHLATLGAIDVPRDRYHDLLDAAIGRTADFYVWRRDEFVGGRLALEALATAPQDGDDLSLE